MLLENIYSTGITHDDCHYSRHIFMVKAAGSTGLLFYRLVLQRKEILEQLETEEEMLQVGASL